MRPEEPRDVGPEEPNAQDAMMIQQSPDTHEDDGCVNGDVCRAREAEEQKESEGMVERKCECW
jgi:hypothetical protein